MKDDINPTVASIRFENIRNKLTALRNDLGDLMCDHNRFAERMEHFHGYFTTGISAMYHSLQTIKEAEIKRDDEEFGQSWIFKSRGIGLDTCPGCFVCGGSSYMMPNISAFVDSKHDGEFIVAMFDQGAWLDYREREPNWIQVKIGACKKHKPALMHLDKLTSIHNVIRKHMVDDVIFGHLE